MEEFDLQPGEYIVRSVRQHPFVLIIKLLPLFIAALLPVLITAGLSFLPTLAPELQTFIVIPSAYIRFATGIWWLFLWMLTFSTLTKYYLNVWIITNVRIVDIEQYGFFNREVSSFLLLRVQDVTTEIYGLIPTLIGFGKLNVETAGSTEKFCMSGIAHPQYIRDVIMDQVAKLHPSDESGGV